MIVNYPEVTKKKEPEKEEDALFTGTKAYKHKDGTKTAHQKTLKKQEKAGRNTYGPTHEGVSFLTKARL